MSCRLALPVYPALAAVDLVISVAVLAIDAASTNHDPGATTAVDICGIDMVPGTNTATSVGIIQGCTTLAGADRATTIDIIVNQIPAFTGGASGLGGS